MHAVDARPGVSAFTSGMKMMMVGTGSMNRRPR